MIDADKKALRAAEEIMALPADWPSFRRKASIQVIIARELMAGDHIVGWAAYSPKTNGRLFAESEDMALARGQRMYGELCRDFVLQPLGIVGDTGGHLPDLPQRGQDTPERSS